MQKLLSFTLFVASLLFLACISENTAGEKQEEYVCMPCGSDCDAALHKAAGKCSHCNMDLVKKSTVRHKEIRPADLCSFIKDMGGNNVLLLDVRTVAEFEGKATEKFGRLSGAVNIPIQELSSRIKELSEWKEKQIIVYCSHSHRSPRASYLLSQNGFNHVTNMSGGMSVWPSEVMDKDCNQKLFIKQ